MMRGVLTFALIKNKTKPESFTLLNNQFTKLNHETQKTPPREAPAVSVQANR